MTTEMKQLLALLLLGCALSVYGDKGAKKKDPCTQGWVAAEVFIEYRRCGDPNSFSMAQDVMLSIRQNMTVNNLGRALTNYCSTVLPKMITCFEGNIENCSRGQQETLQSLIQDTGFFCEPNTPNTTNSKMRYILSRLNDSELANADCTNVPRYRFGDLCINQILAAINLTRDTYNDGLRNVTLEELRTSMQAYYKALIQCGVDHIRANLPDCPQWRRVVLNALSDLAMPANLALAMPFTTAEIDQMFGWSSAQSRREADLGDLFGWFR